MLSASACVPMHGLTNATKGPKYSGLIERPNFPAMDEDVATYLYLSVVVKHFHRWLTNARPDSLDTLG